MKPASPPGRIGWLRSSNASMPTRSCTSMRSIARAQGPTLPTPSRPEGGQHDAPTKDQQTELEAAAFRRLVSHLRNRPDVQNIDLMNLAGFCRNCLSNWYLDAAKEKGLDLTKDESREIVYGMPYDEWKALHQREASADQQQAFKQNRPKE